MVSEDYGKPSPAYLRAGMAAAFSDRQAVGVQAVNADPVIEKGVAWVNIHAWPEMLGGTLHKSLACQVQGSLLPKSPLRCMTVRFTQF